MTGILTFHKSNNYGSVLQAYALQRALVKLGISSRIIDYKPYNYDYMYALFRPVHSFDDFRYNLGNAQYQRVIRRAQRKFAEFRKQYMILTDEEYAYGMDLEELDGQFSTLICGSDQIWNPKSKDSDENYFLPFAHRTKKISYAVSMNDGSTTQWKKQALYRQYLLDFDHISVREKDAKYELEQFLGRDIQVSLDPTLLHFQEEYDQICSPQVMKDHYVFFYSIGYSFAAVEAANIIAQRTGLNVYVLYTGRGVKRVLRSHKNIHLIRDAVSPCDFVSLIKYASYVVTDSFHGTAFSIIYEKPFFSVGELDEVGNLRRDSRICNILEELGLENRFISAEQAYHIDLDEEIDYVAVNRRRSMLRQASLTYLESALQEKSVHVGDNL